MYDSFSECIAKNAGTGECSKHIHGRFCEKHRSQIHYKIIDKNGKKIRDPRPTNKKIHFRCVAKNARTGKCSKYAHGRFCEKHKGQYKYGIINKNGKKIRDPYPLKKYSGCIAKNAETGKCSQYTRGRFCKRHWSQFYKKIIDKNGKKLRDPHPQCEKIYFECTAKDAGTGKCTKSYGGRFCGTHYGQYKAGIISWNGKKVREPEVGIKDHRSQHMFDKFFREDSAPIYQEESKNNDIRIRKSA